MLWRAIWCACDMVWVVALTRARLQASNAEKSAGLAQERTERVKTGEIRMRAHRNKYLDSILDTIK